MRILFLSLIFVFAGATITHAVDYTISTNAKQEAILTQAAIDSGLTNQQFINTAIRAAIKNANSMRLRKRGRVLFKKYEAGELPGAADTDLTNLIETYGE